MVAQVFRCSAARSLCISQSRRTKVYYSRSAPSSVVGRIQDAEVSNTKNPLDPTRLDRYLSSIRVADLEPTLDDVERCKPESFSRPDSPRYATEYTNLLEALCRSFSKDQLRGFTELYKLDPIWTRSSRRKTEYAESIIEKAWGWPSLKEIERKQRDTAEVLVKSFTVTPSQLFLMMGRDGADLLQLSMQYNVYICLTSNPLALRVEGLRGPLKGLTEHISSLKKGIIDEVFELPSGRPVRPDLLQRISRMSGAYVENHGNRGKVRICAKDLGDIAAAERLALRASLEVGTRERTVCYNPPSKIRDSPIEISGPQRYAMYPFVTLYSFPWTMHSGGAFRLRRVTDWLDVDSCEDIASTGGLMDNSHRLLNLDKSGEELSRLVYSITPESASHHRRTITASLGHVLISSGDNLHRDTIFPPLRGTLSLPEVLEWVETSRAPLTFVPSVPSAMATVAVDDQRVLRRLVYKTLPQIAGQVSKLPQHVLKFEMELSCPPSTNPHAKRGLESAPGLKDALSFDGLDSSIGSRSSQASAFQSDSPSNALKNGWDLSCQVGSEAYINLMLPDRPMDMQLCIFNWDGIPLMQQPQPLREYADKLRDSLTNKLQPPQPDPPSTFNYEGREYYLHDSLNLTYSSNPDLLSSVSSDLDDLVRVRSESIVDLQSTQKAELYQVKVDGNSEGPSWKHFLATCDQLSVVSLKSRRKKDIQQGVYLEK